MSRELLLMTLQETVLFHFARVDGFSEAGGVESPIEPSRFSAADVDEQTMLVTVSTAAAVQAVARVIL